MRRQYKQAKDGGEVEMLEKTYLYVEDCSGSENTLQISKYASSAPTVTFEYSYDNINWNGGYSSSTTPTSITIPANGKIYLRGKNNAWANSSSFNTIKAISEHNIGGNIMSILYGSEFVDKTLFPNTNSYILCGVFRNNDTLINADKLQLPAIKLNNNAYQGLFRECVNLVAPPARYPALIATYGCYSAMYYNCVKLTKTSEFAATILETKCYQHAYYNCKNITEVALPATNIVGISQCYANMFEKCALLIRISADFVQYNQNALSNWVSNVHPIGEFIMNMDATWDPESYRGVSGVPEGWEIKRKDPNTGNIV